MNLVPTTARGRNDDGIDTGIHKRKRTQNETSSSSSSKQACCSVSSTQRRVAEDSNENRDTNNRTLSTFESLPLEILERIFFYCLNVNLPRVLPKLAAYVSNERVYRLFILLAFWDNDHQHYDLGYNPSEDGHVYGGNPARYGDLGTPTWRENPLFDIFSILRPLGRDYVPLTPEERAALQSGILLCRWCTNKRIRRQLPDLTRLNISRYCINAGYIIEDKKQSPKLEKMLHFEDAEEIFKCDVVRVNKKPPEQHEGKEDQYQRCTMTLRVGDFVLFEFENRTFEEAVWLPILGVLAIPPSLFDANINAKHKGLVRGTLTDAHLSLLETLRFSGQLMIHISPRAFPEISHSRDAIQQGIRIALSTINIRALAILLKFDLFFYRNSQPCYTIPSDHFRIAAQLYIDNTKFHRRIKKYIDEPSISKTQDAALLPFLFLLSSSPESVPHDDPVVKQFALIEGGALGKWLLDLMKVLPRHMEILRSGSRHDGGDGDTFFFAWGPCDDTTMGSRYATEVMTKREFFDLPERWLCHEIYDRYGDQDDFLV